MTTEIIAELIPWGVLILVFTGMLLLQWRVINALDQALSRLSPLPTTPPTAPHPAPAPLPIPTPAAPPTTLHPPAPHLPAPLPIAVKPAPVPAQPPAPVAAGPFAGAPSWFIWALSEIGFHEIGNNQGLNRYIELAKTGAEGDPWCAIFVNAALESCGIPGTQSPSSQSFRANANFVPLSQPSLGCIVVFWRGTQSSGLGHVGFYRGEDTTSIWTLGGNENDMVQIEPLPKTSNSFGIIGYWWPKSVALPTTGPVIMPTGSPSVTTPPISKPAAAVSGVYTNITATMFSGLKSAYGGPIIDASPGVALPFRFTGTRPRVRVTGKTSGVSVDCDIVDIGPWNINDPYWQTGTRPESETGTDMTGRKTNGAGIDLTLAAATATQIDGKGLVDWEFITSPLPVAQATPNVT